MSETDKAKRAAAARQQLADVLMTTGTALAQMAQILAASATALNEAVLEEQAATMDYISCLEAELSRQKALS